MTSMQSSQTIPHLQHHSAPSRDSADGILKRFDASIDRNPVLAFGCFSAFYFVIVFSLSSMKLLWLDELITLHIARLGSVGAIWHALKEGVDPNPPVTYILVHFSRMIFGEHEFALRMPAAIGYWIGLLSLFLYLRRLLPTTWALAGTALSTTMAAFDYSFESRSYGIFYGLAMLAFFCWSRTVSPQPSRLGRSAALVGMTLALAAGVSTNYFAALAFLPIAAGEMTRTVLRYWRWHPARNPFAKQSWPPLHAFVPRIIDLRVWIALALAASPLLLFRSLIAHSIAQFAPYAWNKVSLSQVADSYTEMIEVILYPILALFVLAALAALMTWYFSRCCTECRARLLPKWLNRATARNRSDLSIPLHEAAGVLAFMLYPVLGYVLASIRVGMLSPRFVIPVCFGFAITATLVCFQLFGKMRFGGIAFLCFALSWLIARESYVGYLYEEQKQCFYKVLARLPQTKAFTPPETPIVIPDPLLALSFQHYAPADLAARVVFPVDFPAIRFYRHDDSPEENLWAGRKLIYTLRIVPLADFQSQTGKYLVIASDGNWMLDDLLYHRYPVDRLPIDPRGQAMGGFTPMARGNPTFYTSHGDAAGSSDVAQSASQVPFRTADNLPQATELPQVPGAQP